MSTHPTDEALFDCAVHENPDVRAHVRGCPACEVRFRRLSAGAALIAAASDPSAASGVDWRALDPAIIAAAERTAADIRAGRLRAPRRVHPGVYVGVALAAAAAGVMVFRASTHTAQPGVAPQVAVHRAAPRRANGVSPEQQARAPQGAPVEGVVLMVVAPVTYTAPGGAPSVLGAQTALREGGRIAADERGGRAVVALNAGTRLDARAGADVTLARLSSTETLFALTKGEARVDGPDDHTARVAMETGGWTLRAKGGAFVAGVEHDAIRVRVVSGKIGVTRGDGSEREVFAGDEVLLAKSGGELRVVSHTARDNAELDTAYMAAEGRAFTLPALPAGAAVSVAGHGALPSGLSVLRTREPVNLTARVGGDEFALALDPSREAPNAWRRSAARVATNAAVAANGVRGATAPNASPVDTQPRELTPSAASTAAPVAALRGLGHVPGSPTVVDQARRTFESQVASRIAACFESCERNNTCGSFASVWVAFDTNSDGDVLTPNAQTPGSPSLRQCIQQHMLTLTVPAEFRNLGRRLTLDLTRPGAR